MAHLILTNEGCPFATYAFIKKGEAKEAFKTAEKLLSNPHDLIHKAVGRIKWNEGSIYPVLKKMEAQGMIKSYWRVVENERPRKYLNLLEPGKVVLANEKEEWNMVNAMLNKLWSPQV